MGSYTDGYKRALADLEELLNNAVANGGGIHYGDKLIERAHWDHEIRDQIQMLRDDLNG